jgi:hypothetical protein
MYVGIRVIDTNQSSNPNVIARHDVPRSIVIVRLLVNGVLVGSWTAFLVIFRELRRIQRPTPSANAN